MLSNVTSRIGTLLRRRKRAKHLGFQFHRAADFVLPASLRLGTGEMQLKIPKDNGSQTAFVDVLLDDCYRLECLPDDIRFIADIGAHVGLFSIAARNRWPTSVINAYEPNPDLKPYWSHHSGQADFQVYPDAVGLKAGTVSLVADPESVQVRSESHMTGEINQLPFAEVVSRIGGSVDLVKLDCEGAEWEILKDVASFEAVRFLTMEFHLWAGYSLEELKRRIRELGFCIEHCQLAGEDFGLLLARK